MELCAELEKRLIVEGRHNVVSVTGGGGKTTMLKLFGKYLSDKGYSVLITTTTKIQSPDTYDFGAKHAFQAYSDIENYQPEEGDLVFYAEKHPTLHKMVSPEMEKLAELVLRFDVTLIEADGSRQLPLKIHTVRDPVILPETTAFIGIMASRAIGKVAGDVTFGLEGDERLVDGHFLEWYFNTPEGILKGKGDVPGVIVVNGADEVPVPDYLFDFTRDMDVLIASEERDEIYTVL